MTVEQVAQSLGVSAETLVQEVIVKQAAWHTVCTAIIVLALLITAACVIYLARKGDTEGADIMLIFVSITAIFLLLESHNFIAWCAAPETTAREYIVENYGGDAT